MVSMRPVYLANSPAASLSSAARRPPVSLAPHTRRPPTAHVSSSSHAPSADRPCHAAPLTRCTGGTGARARPRAAAAPPPSAPRSAPPRRSAARARSRPPAAPRACSRARGPPARRAARPPAAASARSHSDRVTRSDRPGTPPHSMQGGLLSTQLQRRRANPLRTRVQNERGRQRRQGRRVARLALPALDRAAQRLEEAEEDGRVDAVAERARADAAARGQPPRPRPLLRTHSGSRSTPTSVCGALSGRQRLDAGARARRRGRAPEELGARALGCDRARGAQHGRPAGRGAHHVGLDDVQRRGRRRGKRARHGAHGKVLLRARGHRERRPGPPPQPQTPCAKRPPHSGPPRRAPADRRCCCVARHQPSAAAARHGKAIATTRVKLPLPQPQRKHRRQSHARLTSFVLGFIYPFVETPIGKESHALC